MTIYTKKDLKLCIEKGKKEIRAKYPSTEPVFGEWFISISGRRSTRVQLSLPYSIEGQLHKWDSLL
jgi:hypothetical protein